MGDRPSTRIMLGLRRPLFLEALRDALDSEPDLQVVAEARDGLLAVSLAERTKPDVAIVDVELPNVDGVEVARVIHRLEPGCRVLVLCEENDGPTLIRSLEAGATGFLTRVSRLEQLIDAARAIAAGRTVIEHSLLEFLVFRLVHWRRIQDQARRVVHTLSVREREVLALMVAGKGNQPIATALGISPQTVRTHVHRLFGKLGVHTRLEARAFVIRNEVMDDLLAPSASRRSTG